MNIGMISFYLPSENKIGSGYQAHYMANALVRRGHAVTMHTPVSRPEDALYEVTQIPVGASQRLWRFASNLRKVDWSRFDILHAHGEDYRLHTHLRPPHIRTMHGSCLAESLHVPGLKEKIRMLYLGMTEMLAFAAADVTVGVSRNTARSYPWIKRVILNGVDASMFSPGELSQKESVPTLLFVGTYQNRKRGKLLMELFQQQVLPKIPAAQLWMVCSDAPAAPQVQVLGRLSTPELADRFRRAWVFCLPSTYEGFGVPYIEAMASGTPVVASPNPGAREVLTDGKFGIVASDEELGDALVQLLTNGDDRQRLRQLGLERARDFEWNHIAAQYEALYAELLANAPRDSTTAAKSGPSVTSA